MAQNSILEALAALLSGQGAAPAMASQPAQMPFPMADAQRGGRVGPMGLPQNGPMPQPRPTDLPGGSFAPNSQAPIPQPRPQPPQPQPMMPPVQTAPPAQPQMQPPASPQMQNPQANPLAGMMGGDNGGQTRGFQQIMRAFGAGAGNLGNTGGDPFRSFGQGLGGAAANYQGQEDAMRSRSIAQDNQSYARNIDASKTAYDRSRDSVGDQRYDADMQLRQAAEARAAKAATLNEQKTAAEIERIAKSNGLTTKDMLEIERIAQAAGEGEYDSAKRKQMVEEKRQELLQQFGKSDRLDGPGLTGGGGLSSPPEPGTVEGGFKFIGGDPSDRANWTPAT